MKFQPLASMALTIIMALAASPAFCIVKLMAPETVGKGNAFVAQAASDKPTEELIFTWLGKKIPIRAASNQKGWWTAQILLPVPLEEKAQKLDLMVSANNASQAKATIKTVPVKRPVQNLTVDKKYVDPPAEVKARIQADREKVRQALQSANSERQWQLPLLRPVPGTVSSQFGLKRVFNGKPRGEHKGLDLRGAQGTPIHAAADGVVALADDLYYSGNTVYVNHGEGVFSAYLHMSESKVKPGERVKRGQVIGLVGATGRVTGPHLHLSVLAQGQPVDPLPLLERTPVRQTAPQQNRR